MAFFQVVAEGYGLLFPVFASSRCVCVIDGSLIEQHAPIPSLSQLSVSWLSVASRPCTGRPLVGMRVCVHIHVV